MRNRLAAVLLVGVTGYGCGAIFAFHGAPDLALTQFLVETLTLVIFVLVLRALPAEADCTNIKRVPAAARRCSRSRSARPSRRWPRSRWRAPHRHADRRSAARRSVLPRPRRQHRQRAAGRHPRVGHHGRDHRCCWSPPRVWRQWCSGTGGLGRHRGSPTPASLDIGRLPTPPTARPPATSRGCAAANCATPGTGRWCSRSPTRMIFPLIMVLSAYFFFAGHNTPGGGFAGGLTAGLALVLRYLAGGRYELGETLPLDAGKILGAGLGLSAGTAVASLLVGAPVLSSALIAARRAGAGHGQVRHRAVLRPRRVPDRRRPCARRAAQPRRPGGRRDGRAPARRWRDDHLPGSR